jgi:hypothetical protein
MVSEEECKCVDPDGNEIENCRCFRTFEPGQFAWSFYDEGSSGARIGITLTMAPGEGDESGARIQSVMEDGPADRAGLQVGDIVTHIDGISVFDPLLDEEAERDLELDASLPTQRLLQLARALEPGDEVEIRYLREGEARSTLLEAEALDHWGGNFMYFSDEGEGIWNAEEFAESWKEAWDPEAFAEHFHEAWDAEAFAEHFKEAWDSEEFTEAWQEAWDAKEYGEKWKAWVEEFEGFEPEALAFVPEGGRVGYAEGVWFGGEEYLTACPGSDEPGNYVLLSNRCIGGLQMEELNPKLGEYFGTQAGVLVADIHEDSMLGLEAGDVILSVGDREATDPARLRKILRSYEADEEVTLHIMRKKQEMTVSGTLGR